MANKKAVNIYADEARQGDVLAYPVAALPKTVKRQPQPAKTFIVKRGEASGHAHVIDADDITLWLDDDGQRFLEVLNDTLLKHVEETSGKPTIDHGSVPLAKGLYRLPEQVEFDDDDIRAVAD